MVHGEWLIKESDNRADGKRAEDDEDDHIDDEVKDQFENVFVFHNGWAVLSYALISSMLSPNPLPRGSNSKPQAEWLLHGRSATPWVLSG